MSTAANWLAEAQQHFQVGRHDEAVRCFREVLKLQPDNYVARNQLAISCVVQGQASTAINELDIVLAQQPEFFEAWLNLGNILLHQAKFEQAIVVFRRALELNNSDAVAHNSLAVAFVRAGNRDAALHHAKIAVQLQPEYAEAIANLGGIHLDQGRLEVARELLERAWMQKNSLHGVLLQLGQIALAQERPADAKVILDNFLAQHPTHSVGCFDLGRACEALGEREQALLAYQAALQFEPNFVEARQALDSLVQRSIVIVTPPAAPSQG